MLPPKNLIFQITNSLLAYVGQKTQKDKKTNAFPSDVTQFVSQPRERHDDQENEDEKVHHLVAQAGKYVGRAAACAYFFCFIFH